MNAKIVTFSSQGDKTLLEYDPATADMEEVRSRSTWQPANASRKSRASSAKS